ncbi:MAG: extracellular solute-binding protein [Anaerolineae bacterium]
MSIFLAACAGPSAPVALTPLATATPTRTATPAPVARPPDTPRPPESPPPRATPTPVTTRLLLWHNLPPAQAAQLAADVAAFERQHPAAVVELHPYDDPQTLAAAIIEGRVDYDVLLGPAPLLAPLQQAGRLQPVSELFPAGFLDGFAGVTLTGAARDGQLWGLPDTAGFHLLLYFNKELLEAPPATTDELAELAAALTGGAQWGLALNSFDPLWLLPWLTGYGGQPTGPTGAPTLNSAAMVEALTLHRDWLAGEAGIAPPVSYVEARDLFNNGQAAMLIDGEWAIAELAAEAQIPWGVAPLPAVGSDAQPAAPLVLGRYWAVGAETEGRRAEAAIAFLEFITRAERQLAWTAKFGLLPTRRDALANPQILTDPVLRVSAGQMQAGSSVPLGIDVDALLDAMRAPLRQLLNGELSPEEAAQLMQAQTQ